MRINKKADEYFELVSSIQDYVRKKVFSKKYSSLKDYKIDLECLGNLVKNQFAVARILNEMNKSND